MFDFLRKAEDVATRWFWSGHTPETSMDHGQQLQAPSHDLRMASPAAGPQSMETMDALSRLFAGYSDAESHPQERDSDSSGKAQRQTGAALPSQDVVAALATGNERKSEAAFRRAFLGLGKDSQSTKRFSQDLIAGPSLPITPQPSTANHLLSRARSDWMHEDEQASRHLA